jgi:flagellar hook protein FlgE
MIIKIIMQEVLVQNKKNFQGELISAEMFDWLAIEGNGFFLCEHPQTDEWYATRDGTFKRTNSGFTNGQGCKLLGWKVPPPEVEYPLIFPKCKPDEEMAWNNSTMAINNVLPNPFPTKTKQEEPEDSKRAFENLEPIDFYQFKKNNFTPTTYVNFKGNLKVQITPNTEYAIYKKTMSKTGVSSSHLNLKFDIVDNKGELREMFLVFMKTKINEWSYEIFPAENYISSINYQEDETKVVSYGKLKFNENGSLKEVASDTLTKIIPWTDGTPPSKITFSFGQVHNTIESNKIPVFERYDGLSQVGNKPAIKMHERDGNINSSFKGIKATEKGEFIILFRSGEEKHAYDIPLARVENPSTQLKKTSLHLYSMSSVPNIYTPDEEEVGNLRFKYYEPINDFETNYYTQIVFEPQKKVFSKLSLIKSKMDNSITVEGTGFISIKCDNQLFLTRNFENINGQLVNKQGCKLLGYKIGDYQDQIEDDGHLNLKSLKTISIDNLQYFFRPTTTINIGSHVLGKEASKLPSDYKPSNLNTSMSGNKDFPSDLKYVNCGVIDSLGLQHELKFYFGYDGTYWNIEITRAADLIHDAPLIITTGKLDFFKNGAVDRLDYKLDDISVDWDNGSETQNIRIDWGDYGSADGTMYRQSEFSGIRLLAGASETFRRPKDNGIMVLPFSSAKITKDGYVEGDFTGVYHKNLYRIPLINVEFETELYQHGIEPGYRITEAVGDIEVFFPGEMGMGTILLGYTENVATD